MQPYLFDATDEEKEAGELVNWLYSQPWGTVGGPLHIMTDDGNLEDHWFAEGGTLYKEIESPYFYDGEPKEEDLVKLRRILEIMRPLTPSRRQGVLHNAETMDGPY